MDTSLPKLLVKSISLAARNATISPGVLQPWIDDINRYVTEHGKFSKSQVAYIPFSPPPVFWDYKCKKCRFLIEPNTCKVVEGKISQGGWCASWLPPEGKPALSWVKELSKGDW